MPAARRLILTIPFVAGLSCVAAACSARPPAASDEAIGASNAASIDCSEVLTQGYGAGRTNAQPCETTLTRAAVKSSLGKLYSRAVDGRVYAQPLYVKGVTIDGVVRDVVYVATANNKIYALDANETSADPHAGRLWSITLGAPANVAHEEAVLTAMSADEICGGALWPTSGIISTPAIDKDAGTMFVVAENESAGGIGGYTFSFNLYAIDIATHAVKGSVAITTPGFNPVLEIQRAGLLAMNGSVYIAFAGACGDVSTPTDVNHGWVFRYEAATLAQKAVFNPSSGDGGVGIWQSGTGLVGKPSTGDVYAMTGNGHGHTSSTIPGCDGATDDHTTFYSDSFLKLSGGTLAAARTQQPRDQQLAWADLDLGSGGPMLLPSGKLVGGGKEGRLFVFDTNAIASDVGGWAAPWNAQATQCVAPATSSDCFMPANNPCPVHGLYAHIHSRAAANDRVFVWGEKDYLRSFNVSGAGLVPFATGAVNAFYDPLTAGYNWQWRTPTMIAASSNGASDGIIWAVKSKGQWRMPALDVAAAPSATLYAFDSDTLTELWNSDAAPADVLASHPRFTVPTVAGGKVYVATHSDEVDVYGLRAPLPAGLPANARIAAASRPSSGRTDVFAVGNDGLIYSSHFDGVSWSPLAHLVLNGGGHPAPAPPGAPLTAIAPDPNQLIVFYVDNEGRVESVWWNAGANAFEANPILDGSSTTAAPYTTGGRATAAPGSPVGAQYFTSGGAMSQIDLALVDFRSTVVGFEWKGGWSYTGNVYGFEDGIAMQRTPVTLVSHDPPNTRELYFVGRDGLVRHSWCASPSCTTAAAWSPRIFAASPSFPEQAPIAAFTKSKMNEDVVAVDVSGRVQRAYWDGSWWHGGTPFDTFSSSGMLAQGAVIATDARGSSGNLLAVDPSGAIRSEWWTSDTWQYPSALAWGGSLTTSWQTFMGAGTAAPSSAMLILHDAPSPGALVMFWIDGSGSIWRRVWSGGWQAPAKL